MGLTEISLRRASTDDAVLLYELQKCAFAALLEKYRDYDTNPGAETLDKTVRRLCEPDSDYDLILLGDVPIGGIRIRHTGDTCNLKQIFILPQYQGNGYAQTAIALAEARYKGVRLRVLDTILQEDKLIQLYEKMGYQITDQIMSIKDGMDIVRMEKLS